MLGAATAIRFLSTSGAGVANLTHVRTDGFGRNTFSPETGGTIVTGPTPVAPGDIGILFDLTPGVSGGTNTTKVVDPDFTEVLSTAITSGSEAHRLTVSYRVFDNNDIFFDTVNGVWKAKIFTGAGTSSLGSAGKILLSFRPNEPINNVAVFDINTESTSGAPANQTLSTTSTGGNWLGFAGIGINGGTLASAGRTFGVSSSSGWVETSGDIQAAFYKIESGNPGTYTVFLDDGLLGSGSNSLISFFLRIT
jgi:hypothetical protein